MQGRQVMLGRGVWVTRLSGVFGRGVWVMLFECFLCTCEWKSV